MLPVCKQIIQNSRNNKNNRKKVKAVFPTGQIWDSTDTINVYLTSSWNIHADSYQNPEFYFYENITHPCYNNKNILCQNDATKKKDPLIKYFQKKNNYGQKTFNVAAAFIKIILCRYGYLCNYFEDKLPQINFPQINLDYNKFYRNSDITVLDNIKIDFLTTHEKNFVIVELSPTEGSSAVVGKVINDGSQTVTIGWFDVPTILHEFGHVLGLVHEHQSPYAKFPWNYKNICNKMKCPPNNWSGPETTQNVLRITPCGTNDKLDTDSATNNLCPVDPQCPIKEPPCKVDHNQKPVKNEENIYGCYNGLKGYDSDSIMLYFFPPIFTSDCKGQKMNTCLSYGDIYTITVSMYGVNGEDLNKFITIIGKKEEPFGGWILGDITKNAILDENNEIPMLYGKQDNVERVANANSGNFKVIIIILIASLIVISLIVVYILISKSKKN
jgi:hypothetical protein